MTVTGRVLEPQGKPVPNASVMVYGRLINVRPTMPAEGMYSKELGRATSDASGVCRVELPRFSLSQIDEMGASALAPG